MEKATDADVMATGQRKQQKANQDVIQFEEENAYRVLSQL